MRKCFAKTKLPYPAKNERRGPSEETLTLKSVINSSIKAKSKDNKSDTFCVVIVILLYVQISWYFFRILAMWDINRVLITSNYIIFLALKCA